MGIKKMIDLENALPADWKELMYEQCRKDYFSDLNCFVANAYKTKEVYPQEKDIFKALELCSTDEVKVIIIGQDPYHGKGQAHGLAFSVNEGVRIPPSLRNIFKELRSDLGKAIPESGNLESWAKQGVLLLNSVLTVEAGQPASHQKKGWEYFTEAIIQRISVQKDNLVFMLWGAFARKNQKHIDEARHLILTSAHPSPFSAARGFFGNKHFSKCNDYLKNKHGRIIIW